MVRTICREGPRSAGFRPPVRSEKECPDWADLAEGSSLAANILFAVLRSSPPSPGWTCHFGAEASDREPKDQSFAPTAKAGLNRMGVITLPSVPGPEPTSCCSTCSYAGDLVGRDANRSHRNPALRRMTGCSKSAADL